MKIKRYVELFGVAGAGKTTSAKILINEAKKEGSLIQMREVVGNNVLFRIKVISSIILIILFIPKILSLYLIPINKNFKNSPYVKKVKRDLITRMIIDTAVIRCLLKNSNDVIINDEGLIGKLVSLSIISNLSCLKIYEIIKILMPKNAILIHIDILPNLALEREIMRKIDLPFFNEMSTKSKKIFFNESVMKYRDLYSKSSVISDLCKFSVNNSGDYKHLIKEIKIITKKMKFTVK